MAPIWGHRFRYWRRATPSASRWRWERVWARSSSGGLPRELGPRSPFVPQQRVRPLAGARATRGPTRRASLVQLPAVTVAIEVGVPIEQRESDERELQNMIILALPSTVEECLADVPPRGAEGFANVLQPSRRRSRRACAAADPGHRSKAALGRHRRSYGSRPQAKPLPCLRTEGPCCRRAVTGGDFSSVASRLIWPAASSPSGTPGWTRTSDPRLRRPLLYPSELRARARQKLP